MKVLKTKISQIDYILKLEHRSEVRGQCRSQGEGGGFPEWFWPYRSPECWSVLFLGALPNEMLSSQAPEIAKGPRARLYLLLLSIYWDFLGRKLENNCQGSIHLTIRCEEKRFPPGSRKRLKKAIGHNGTGLTIKGKDESFSFCAWSVGGIRSFLSSGGWRCNQFNHSCRIIFFSLRSPWGPSSSSFKAS